MLTDPQFVATLNHARFTDIVAKLMEKRITSTTSLSGAGKTTASGIVTDALLVMREMETQAPFVFPAPTA